jgi:hypothetical protein
MQRARVRYIVARREECPAVRPDMMTFPIKNKRIFQRMIAFYALGIMAAQLIQRKD